MTTTAQPGGGAASDADAVPDKSAAQNLSAALDQLWVRFLPEIRLRVEILDAAAAACAANALSTEQREAAHAAAHKLAGTLGTFNLAHGTELAREFELLFAKEEAPESSVAGRLASLAVELRTIVEGR
jgi:HPt (histidine-containing phosphotransfer) domain-containing protein